MPWVTAVSTCVTPLITHSYYTLTESRLGREKLMHCIELFLYEYGLVITFPFRVVFVVLRSIYLYGTTFYRI